MYQVAIIGAGQLGSRHLQGLKIASSSLSITVMDSSEESLKTAKERYESVQQIGEKTIKYVRSIEELPDCLDLVIIATGARPRAAIVRNLLSHSSVRYMILEKILFPQLSEYDEIESLLNNKNIVCWVNCPRRMYGSYCLIKNSLDYSEPIKMEFVSGNWGLCCNTIHFIDVFMYLTQADEYTIDTCGIENHIYDSKRSGYIEMMGSLNISTKNGDELHLTAESSYKGQTRVEIKNGNHYYALDEMKGVLIIDGKEVKVPTPYQSQTTGMLADSILSTGYCPLSMYNKSAKYHKVFITAMLNKYNEIKGENTKLLPIT